MKNYPLFSWIFPYRLIQYQDKIVHCMLFTFNPLYSDGFSHTDNFNKNGVVHHASIQEFSSGGVQVSLTKKTKKSSDNVFFFFFFFFISPQLFLQK